MANISKDVKTKPAGNDDNFIVGGIDFCNIIEKEKFEMKAAQKGVKIEVLSIDSKSTENISISAYDDTVVDFEKRKQQPQFNEKLVNFENKKREIEAKKQNNRDRDIG